MLYSLLIQAKVDPPNYDFSLEKFDIFMPGSNMSDIEKIYPGKQLVFKNEAYTTYKFYIAHLRYKFAIMVQFKNEKVTDFHARLPQYFLHDLFHQSLIKRLGKQDIYKKVEEQAIYIWKNKDNKRHYYSGACTITCFPVYYGVIKLGNNSNDEYQSILNRLENIKKKN